jgi:hypothetical protein
MGKMKSHIRLALIFALLVAIPVDALNFWVFPYPIDVGLPDDATLLEKLIGAQWVILHWPGLYLSDWFDSTSSPTWRTDFVLFVSGYFDTVLLIIAFFGVFWWLRHLVLKYFKSGTDPLPRGRPTTPFW